VLYKNCYLIVQESYRSTETITEIVTISGIATTRAAGSRSDFRAEFSLAAACSAPLPPYPPLCRFSLHPIPVPRKLKTEARKGLAGCGSFSFGSKAKRRASWARLQIAAASAHPAPPCRRPGSGGPVRGREGRQGNTRRVLPSMRRRINGLPGTPGTDFPARPRDGRWRKDQGENGLRESCSAASRERPGPGIQLGHGVRVIPAGYYPRCGAESMVCRGINILRSPEPIFWTALWITSIFICKRGVTLARFSRQDRQVAICSGSKDLWARRAKDWRSRRRV